MVLYVLLRTLGLERLAAIAIATLALLIPASDALWLWGNAAWCRSPSCSTSWRSLAVLKAFASSERRRARALHVIGPVLYLMSVLLYELAAIAILASTVSISCAPRMAALGRWFLDVTCISLVLLFVTLGKVNWLPGTTTGASPRRACACFWREQASRTSSSTLGATRPQSPPTSAVADLACGTAPERVRIGAGQSARVAGGRPRRAAGPDGQALAPRPRVMTAWGIPCSRCVARSLRAGLRPLAETHVGKLLGCAHTDIRSRSHPLHPRVRDPPHP